MLPVDLTSPMSCRPGRVNNLRASVSCEDLFQIVELLSGTPKFPRFVTFPRGEVSVLSAITTLSDVCRGTSPSRRQRIACCWPDLQLSPHSLCYQLGIPLLSKENSCNWDREQQAGIAEREWVRRKDYAASDGIAILLLTIKEVEHDGYGTKNWPAWNSPSYHTNDGKPGHRR